MSQDDGRIETLLIGLDAACLPVLERLFESDSVPTIETLLDEGASAPLESQIPPWTASAWPSLYTGTNPGKHGVFSFLAFDGYDWDVVNASHVHERPVWELLDHHGLSSVVVNVPVTHPPTPFEGALVPGYVAPDEPECHPAGLLDDVRAEIGEYRLYVPRSVKGRDQVEWFRRLVRMRGEAFRYLAGRFDPEFGFVQFQQTDTVFHELPGDFEAVRSVYEAVDEQVDRILEATDPRTVVVASDHGIGPYTDEFRVNEFLRGEGLTRAKRGGEGMPAWKSVRTNRSGESAGPSAVEATATGLLRTAARFGITAQVIGNTLERLGLLELALRYVPWELVRSSSEQVDFPASVAYMRSQIECGVRLNLEGREPDGVVPRDEYDSVRRETISLLEAATTVDGDHVFEAVGPREEYFHGPRTGDAVDIVTVPRDFDVFLQPWLLGEQATTVSNKWDHKREGIVAITGPGVDRDAPIGVPHLFDVAPTILSTLGVPRSDRMDGAPLPVVEATEVMEYPSVEPVSEERTDDELVESRLRDLGYIDVDE